MCSGNGLKRSANRPGWHRSTCEFALALVQLSGAGYRGIVGDGVILHLNAGNGTFSDGTASLSDEIGYLPYSYQFSGARTATYARQGVGATAIADMDGDGKAELITCSYTGSDRFSKRKTIRFSRWNAATARMEEVGRYVLSGALEAVTAPPLFANDNGTLGCAGLWVADIDHDGILDLMVLWEGTSESYIQLLNGKGNLQFDDVTLAALGAYRSTFVEGGFKWASLGYRFQDINGDGFADIVELNGGLSAQRLATGMPTAWINDGHGKFTKQRLVVDSASVTQAQIEALTGCNFCSHASFYGRFVPRSDGRKTLDLLLMNTNEDIGGTPPQERSISLRVLKAR